MKIELSIDEASLIFNLLERDYVKRTEEDNFMSCAVSASDYEMLITRLDEALT